MSAVCCLDSPPGQTVESMQRDVETGLANFDRVCVNIMVENRTAVKPDSSVIRAFCEQVEPLYRENPRVDILMENTDFGVGGTVL